MAEKRFTPPEGFEITGSIRSGNRRYDAGNEEAFAASGVKEADFERLVEAGAISVENAEEAPAEDDSGEGTSGESEEGSLEDHTVDELQEIAADLEIEGRSSMKKAELIEAIEEAQS